MSEHVGVVIILEMYERISCNPLCSSQLGITFACPQKCIKIQEVNHIISF